MSDLALLVRSMAEAGAPPEAIALAVEAVEAERAKDAARRAKRAAERKSQRDRAANIATSDATVARHGGDNPRHGADMAALVSAPPPCPPHPSITPTPPSDEDKGEARAPHRMPRSFRLSEADREFAKAEGWTESEIDDGEAELIDYWANPKLPASKALKLDWSAVWRNRVRDLGKRRGSSRNVTAFQRQGNLNGQRSHAQQSGSRADARLAAMADAFCDGDDERLPAEGAGEPRAYGGSAGGSFRDAGGPLRLVGPR